MAKPKTKTRVYSPPFYTATPSVGPYLNPEDEGPYLRKLREQVTSSDYYKYLRSLPNYPEVRGWRPDYLNLYQDPEKFGGTEGLEPTPTVFAATPAGFISGTGLQTSPNHAQYYYKNYIANGQIQSGYGPNTATGNFARGLEALKYAMAHGYRLPRQATDPYYIAAQHLKEVRHDGGANPPFVQTYSAPVRNAMRSAQELTDPRFGSAASDYLVQTMEKARVANKLGLDFYKAWNGTGNAAGGGSGANYSYRMRHDFIPAAQHPRNAALIQYIRDRLDPNTPYTTPMTMDQYYTLDRKYGQRKSAARKAVNAKLDDNILRRLQWGVFGGGGIFGVPDEYNPDVAVDRVKPPDYQRLTGLADPVSGYNRGGIASLLKRRR